MLLSHVGLTNLMLSLSHLITIQGRESNSGDFVIKKGEILMLVCIRRFTDRFISN